MFKFATQPIRLSQAIKDSLKLYFASFGKLWYWVWPVSLVNAISETIFPVYSPEQGFSVLGLILMLVSLFIGVIFFIIVIHRAQAVGTQQPVSVMDSIKLARKKCLIAFVTFLIVTTIVILASFAFVIPGIYFFVVLIFYLPAIVIDNAGILSSMKESVTLTHKKWFQTFLLILIPMVASIVFLALLGLISEVKWYQILTSVVAGIVFMPYYTATLLVQYNNAKLARAARVEARDSSAK